MHLLIRNQRVIEPAMCAGERTYQASPVAKASSISAPDRLLVLDRLLINSVSYRTSSRSSSTSYPGGQDPLLFRMVFGFGSSSSSASTSAQAGSSTQTPEAPNREQRAACWAHRDAYFQCLDKNGILQPGDEESKGVCATEKKGYQGACSKSWVSCASGPRIWPILRPRIRLTTIVRVFQQAENARASSKSDAGGTSEVEGSQSCQRRPIGGTTGARYRSQYTTFDTIQAQHPSHALTRSDKPRSNSMRGNTTPQGCETMIAAQHNKRCLGGLYLKSSSNTLRISTPPPG